MSWRDIVHVETQRGDPIVVGEVTLRLEAQAVMFRWPRGFGVWTHPTAVEVTRDGETTRLPVVNLTRRLLFACWGVSFGFAVFVLGRSLFIYLQL